VSHELVALVPMRHQSERVPGKNYRPLAGRPLFHHIVSTLLAVPEIDLVAIDTDSPAIAADAADMFPDVLVLARPAHLLGGDVPMNEILLHDVDVVEADLYLQTHSTNPLLHAATISAAIEAFQAARDGHDSLFAVTPLHTRLWTEDGRPLNHDPNVLMRTQDLPPVLEENSCLYIFTADGLRLRGSRIGERPLLYPIDRAEAWDIDDEMDWSVVEALIGRERQS
jgi:CMP-N-acetylneuraminic acid synthetase